MRTDKLNGYNPIISKTVEYALNMYINHQNSVPFSQLQYSLRNEIRGREALHKPQWPLRARTTGIKSNWKIEAQQSKNGVQVNQVNF